MDSNRRHKLAQNELAQWFINQYEEWILPNGHWLTYVLLGLIVVVGIVYGTAKITAWNQSASWRLYFNALHSETPEADLERIADSTGGHVSVLARLALAQLQLGEGCNQILIDKAKAVEQLEKAAGFFQKVQKSTSDPTVLQQAGFGLGQTWEALASSRTGNEDLSKAEAEYKQVAERWGNDFTGKRAKEQLELITRPGTKKFFELSANRVVAASKGDDFKVNFDQHDPFAAGPAEFDPQSAFGEKAAPAPTESASETPKPE
jgi:hypothetical protein